MRKLLLVGLMLLTSITTFAQVNIVGKVFDVETNDPLPGATIVVEGTNDGTVTGFDGTFSLSANEGTSLLISYLGYETARVLADDSISVGSIIPYSCVRLTIK